MHVKGSPLHFWPDKVIHAGIVGAVCQIKAFGQNLQVSPIAHLESASDTHVKVHVIRTQTGIARSSDWTIIGRVAIAIQISAGQKVEWVTTVVFEHGG